MLKAFRRSSVCALLITLSATIPVAAQYSPLPPRNYPLGDKKDRLVAGDTEGLVEQKLGLSPESIEEATCNTPRQACKIKSYRDKDQVIWIYFFQDPKSPHHWKAANWKIENFWRPQNPFDPNSQD
ncbi:MAG: hypothetical protein ACR2HL_00065 [Methylocystis sp.]|jgi:hypothetical protein